MTDQPAWFAGDLESDVGADERALLWSVADRLIGARPFPRAAFRAAFGQRLAALQAGRGGIERPRALWARIGALAASGTVLLAIVAIGLAGSGPFAK
jgi:hypothetical protein